MRASELRRLAAGALVVTLGLVGESALAEGPGNVGAAQAAALAKAQALLRQVNEQKQKAELENAQLKASVASLEQELKHARLQASDVAARLTAADEGAQRSQARLDSAQKKNDKLTTQLKDVVARYKAQARELADQQAEAESLRTELAATRTQLVDADQKNLQLYEMNREILEKYTGKSRWTALLQREPFTGVSQVRLDSEAEELKRRMAETLREGNVDAAGR